MPRVVSLDPMAGVEIDDFDVEIVDFDVEIDDFRRRNRRFRRRNRRFRRRTVSTSKSTILGYIIHHPPKKNLLIVTPH